jgi:hypothetical protein
MTAKGGLKPARVLLFASVQVVIPTEALRPLQRRRGISSISISPKMFACPLKTKPNSPRPLPVRYPRTGIRNPKVPNKLTNLKVTLLLNILLAVVSFPSTVQAQYGAPPPQPNGPSLYDQVEKALKKSQLTLPNSQPFHIKFSITETSNPQSGRHAEIEESWLSPAKYRRTIKSPEFSQTLIVNGDAVSEINTGDYYPYWLYEFVDAAFDPVPFAAGLKQINARGAAAPSGKNDTACGDVHFRVDRWVICFNHDETFASIFTKSYDATYKDYEKFGNKLVARQILHDPESANELVATITALDALTQPDESLFAVANPTPPAERITLLPIGEDTMRSLVVGGADIAWPTVVGGKDSGGCGAFVSADRAGNVREVYSAGCDNFAVQEPLRQILLKWKLKPAVVKGVPVQVNSLMGFAFKVQVTPAPPVVELSNDQARQLASNITEPNFPAGSAPHGTKVEIQISVDDDGKLLGVNNIKNVGATFLPASAAVGRWKFQPYLKDGKAVPFNANIIFTVP